MICSKCAEERDEGIDPKNIRWGHCPRCDTWAWIYDASPTSDNQQILELRRKLKKANRENEDLRQVISFQRDALGHLGEQFIKLSTLLKEKNV